MSRPVLIFLGSRLHYMLLFGCVYRKVKGSGKIRRFSNTLRCNSPLLSQHTTCEFDSCVWSFMTMVLFDGKCLCLWFTLFVVAGTVLALPMCHQSNISLIQLLQECLHFMFFCHEIPSGKLTHGKSPCSIGNTFSKGPFSIAMLVYRSVSGKQTEIEHVFFYPM